MLLLTRIHKLDRQMILALYLQEANKPERLQGVSMLKSLLEKHHIFEL